jgi:hypothetical protein
MTFITLALSFLAAASVFPSLSYAQTDFTKLDLKKFDFAKLDVSKFSFAHGKEVIDASDIPELRHAITVALPAPVDDTSEDPDKLGVEAIKGALPLVLKQFDIPNDKIGDKTERGAKLFESAVKAIFNEQDLDNFSPSPSRLMPRGLLGDIGDWFEDKATDVACGIFATGALPAYLVAAGLFASKNPSSTPTTDHQDYFIAALHGNLWKDNLRISYKARRPPGFGNARGTAFGKRIYTIDSTNNVCTTSGFRSTMKLMLHETTHSAQYKSVNWSLPRFGTKYLFQYCKAGFSYRKNSMEKEAENKAGQLGSLIDDSLGLQFFQFWVAKGLKSTLGMPTAKTYTSVATTPKKIWQLQFEKGVLQITPGPCYRTLTYAEAELQQKAKCTILGPCPNNNDKRGEQELNARSPPIGWNPPPKCNSQSRAQANARCRKQKEEWANVDGAKPFICNVALPAVR